MDSEKAINDHNAQKSEIPPEQLSEWNRVLSALTNKKEDLLLEWSAIGHKAEIESAKKQYDLSLEKALFIKRWSEAKNSDADRVTTTEGVNFFYTTCLPNDLWNNKAQIWRKVTLSKQEISQLAQKLSQEVPADVIALFGNTEAELDAIHFEFCIVEIVRNWFDESLLNSRNWKYRDDNKILSEGNENMKGEIPAYPVKIALSKNIELVFTQGSPKNEEIKNKLMEGQRVFFGPLLLKTIPLNLSNDKINAYRVQSLSTNQLSVISQVATERMVFIPKDPPVRKFEMMDKINDTPQPIIRQNVEVKSIFTAPMVARTMTARPMVVLPHDAPQPPLPPPQLSTVSGKVVNQQGQPIEGAEVQMMKVDTARTQSFLSLGDGTYSFHNIENGTYLFSVKKTGFATNEKKIEINGNANQDFLLTLQPTPAESFQVIAVICKKFPKLPNPIAGAEYI